MFGSGNVYFAGSPVEIDISGLQWPPASPFDVVILDVVYDSKVAGEFRVDTGGQETVSIDISSALRAIWSDYDFAGEVSAANGLTSTLTDEKTKSKNHTARQYYFRIYTEYIDDTDGVFTRTQCKYENLTDIPGGRCTIGRWTEWERFVKQTQQTVTAPVSTKPSTPERVGSTSITSKVKFASNKTTSTFYRHDYEGNDAPTVLRDTYEYTDFLFVNRRGAVETCSAPAMEAMTVEAESKQYARVERPSFVPERSLMAVASGGRRSWQMSSGYQTREWARWWAEEFLAASRHWMLIDGSYVPVVVKGSKKSNTVYDRSKQQYQHVDFTVTLALEG